MLYGTGEIERRIHRVERRTQYWDVPSLTTCAAPATCDLDSVTVSTLEAAHVLLHSISR